MFGGGTRYILLKGKKGVSRRKYEWFRWYRDFKAQNVAPARRREASAQGPARSGGIRQCGSVAAGAGAGGQIAPIEKRGEQTSFCPPNGDVEIIKNTRIKHLCECFFTFMRVWRSNIELHIII